MLLNKIGFLNVIIILNLCYPRKHCMLMINGTHRMFNDTVKPQLKAGKDIKDEKDLRYSICNMGRYINQNSGTLEVILILKCLNIIMNNVYNYVNRIFHHIYQWGSF